MRARRRLLAAIAVEARLGGYSGPGIEKVGILDGIRARLGPDVRVRYEPGPGRVAAGPVTVPAERLATRVEAGGQAAGLTGEYFDNIHLAGEARAMRIDPQIDFAWTLSSPVPAELARDWCSARGTGTITGPPGGAGRLGVEGSDGYRLYLDGGC